ncbi:intracellular growth attenuator family protein [Tamlana haliotis]|uniref:Intracellular growth attenuator family protein n=1 Tax=Pseudotamlana haliotis TaxID=2614804 RepID=A0A6N6MBU9_9FLAO|nr:intracellular growth attenuator family protein [Tamlana haliotis]
MSFLFLFICNFGCWLLVVGCWMLVVGCWLLVVGCWKLILYLYARKITY